MEMDRGQLATRQKRCGEDMTYVLSKDDGRGLSSRMLTAVGRAMEWDGRRSVFSWSSSVLLLRAVS